MHRTQLDRFVYIRLHAVVTHEPNEEWQKDDDDCPDHLCRARRGISDGNDWPPEILPSFLCGRYPHKNTDQGHRCIDCPHAEGDGRVDPISEIENGINEEECGLQQFIDLDPHLLVEEIEDENEEERLQPHLTQHLDGHIAFDEFQSCHV